MKGVNTLPLILCLSLAVIFCRHHAIAQQTPVSRYDVSWDTPGKSAADAMPCGGGDIGLNVWVENGEVLCYLSRSGTFDENNAMLKLGRVRLKLSSGPLGLKGFKQELKLQQGSVRIRDEHTDMEIWVDVFNPVVHIDIKNDDPVKVTATYESWRYADHLITDTRECRTNSYKRLQSFPITTYKDDISFQGNDVVFYHRNRAGVQDVFSYTVQMEGMGAVTDQLYDPLKNNTFGGMMRGDQMVAAGIDSGTYADAAYRGWSLQSKKAVRSQHLTIGLEVAQTAGVSEWSEALQYIMETAGSNRDAARRKTLAWWQQFWDRSYIYIDSKDTAAVTVGRNYQLFRYMLGCNAFGKWPTKFNGGLFTFDPRYVSAQYPFSPDFRLWGGGTMTAQNQRLVYYPFLKSGDADLMKGQFDFYLRIKKNAELRSQTYWAHPGACFTEQIENFGLPNVTEYEPKRPTGADPGVEYNAWLEYQWETVFEFCLMMLDANRYTGISNPEHIAFIESCLTFYDEHYRQLAKKRGVKELNEKGQYILFPTSAAETFKMTYNSTTVIAALQVILQRMSELPEIQEDTLRLGRILQMKKRVPPIALTEFTGHTTIAPALAWERVQNTETPQLYPVFPWGIYGVGKPDLHIARNTWEYDPHAVKFRSHVGWRQYNIFAARLGLTAEAAALTKLKFANGPHRFPAFWGPGFDWTPDHNWGGAAMTGLQEMLLQVDGNKIYLLPAWPAEWNAVFKLHAPYNTIIEGKVSNGKVEQLKVTPAARERDVIIM
ncbi:DUF5703 domain-containing protein [Chitinophaga filiformis]|uniref:DUF5703 domain-containing protein n=1 Tax=Chitinophaga filiformis TaxID=104663 RepID=UPI001F31F3FF|nr:DUF5703 domain-containing protein [Chitinophaga filiformis]MCF6402596.1 DUF5703 domain-containing protein [Chitinophaga filiformis]MCF6403486.1 DUF5703 domain-containing protein [Chitinophaga filiformis]